jgi:hypothetical protein
MRREEIEGGESPRRPRTAAPAAIMAAAPSCVRSPARAATGKRSVGLGYGGLIIEYGSLAGYFRTLLAWASLMKRSASS